MPIPDYPAVPATVRSRSSVAAAHPVNQLLPDMYPRDFVQAFFTAREGCPAPAGRAWPDVWKRIVFVTGRLTGPGRGCWSVTRFYTEIL